MKRFEVTVTIETAVTVEIDENIVNAEWIADFEQSMYPVRDLQQLAEFLAEAHVQTPERRMIEGFGNITRNGALPYSSSDWDRDAGMMKAEEDRDQPEPGFNIEIKYEEREDVSSYEIKEGGAE